MMSSSISTSTLSCTCSSALLLSLCLIFLLPVNNLLSLTSATLILWPDLNQSQATILEEFPKTQHSYWTTVRLITDQGYGEIS